MSWMDVAGKIYRCLDCGGATRVEYEGGLQPTHVSDLVVMEQLELAERYADSSDYLCQEGLCLPCVEALAGTDQQRAPAARIALLLQELKLLAERYQSSLADEIGDAVARWVDRLDLQTCRKLAGRVARAPACGTARAS